MAHVWSQEAILEQDEIAEGESSSSNQSSSEDESTSEEEEVIAHVRGMSAPQAVFNIVKNIVGEGMLSLPAGVAAGTGLGLSLVFVTLFGLLLAYTFSVMGRACHVTKQRTHKGCGEVLSGPVLAQTMAVVCMFKTAFTCLAYSIVIGESCSRILHFFGLRDPFWTSRQTTLITIMTCILLPLVLQRDLSILSYTSLVGIAGEVFVVSVMQARYSDGSYTPEGQFYYNITKEDRPSFDDGGIHYFKTSITTFVLLGSVSTAFIAHYNGPKFYSQLRRANPKRFSIVVATGFFISWMIYAWVMCVGYLTFGNACEGLILNNYSEEDSWATAARVAIGFAVLFGFPLAFTSLRDNTISALGLDDEKRSVFCSVTFALLVPITSAGCFLEDLGLVNSLGGAIFGASITLIFPGALAYLASRNKRLEAKEFGKTEGRLALLVIASGFVLLVFGSIVNVIKKCFPELLHKGSS